MTPRSAKANLVVKKGNREAISLLYVVIWFHLVVWGLDIDKIGLPDQLSVVRWITIIVVSAVAAVDVATRPIPSRVVIGVATLAMALLPSVLLSKQQYQSIAEYGRFVGTLAFVLVASARGIRVKFRSVVVSACSALLIASAVSIILFPEGSAATNVVEAATLRVREAGVTWHPNILAVLALIVVTDVLSKTLFGPRRSLVDMLPGLIMAVVALFCLVKAGSRTVEISAVVMVAICVLIRAGWLSMWKLAIIFANILAIVAPLLIITVGLDERVADEGSAYAGSNVERLFAWHAASDLFKANPAFGQGFGADIVFAGADVNEKDVTELRYAHNVLLTYMADGGVVGLAAAFLVVLGLTSLFVRTLSRLEYDRIARARSWAEVYDSRIEYLTASLIGLQLVQFSAVEGGLQGVVVVGSICALSTGLLTNPNASRFA